MQAHRAPQARALGKRLSGHQVEMGQQVTTSMRLQSETSPGQTVRVPTSVSVQTGAELPIQHPDVCDTGFFTSGRSVDVSLLVNGNPVDGYQQCMDGTVDETLQFVAPDDPGFVTVTLLVTGVRSEEEYGSTTRQMEVVEDPVTEDPPGDENGNGDGDDGGGGFLVGIVNAVTSTLFGATPGEVFGSVQRAILFIFGGAFGLLLILVVI